MPVRLVVRFHPRFHLFLSVVKLKKCYTYHTRLTLIIVIGPTTPPNYHHHLAHRPSALRLGVAQRLVKPHLAVVIRPPAGALDHRSHRHRWPAVVPMVVVRRLCCFGGRVSRLSAVVAILPPCRLSRRLPLAILQAILPPVRPPALLLRCKLADLRRRACIGRALVRVMMMMAASRRLMVGVRARVVLLLWRIKDLEGATKMAAATRRCHCS